MPTSVKDDFDAANLVVFGRVEAGAMLPLACDGEPGVQYAVRVRTAFKGRLARDQRVWFASRGTLLLGEEYFLFLARPSAAALSRTGPRDRWGHELPPLDVDGERACARQRPGYALKRSMWTPDLDAPRVVAVADHPYGTPPPALKPVDPSWIRDRYVHLRSGAIRRLVGGDDETVWVDFANVARVMNRLALDHAAGRRPAAPRFLEAERFIFAEGGVYTAAQWSWHQFQWRPVWPWLPGLVTMWLGLWIGRAARATRLRPWRGWLVLIGVAMCGLAGVDALEHLIP